MPQTDLTNTPLGYATHRAEKHLTIFLTLSLSVAVSYLLAF